MISYSKKKENSKINCNKCNKKVIKPEPINEKCTNNDCNGLQVKSTNYKNLKNAFMVVDRVFDSVEVSIEDMLSNVTLPLIIQNAPMIPYKKDQHVCITKMAFVFNCIGFATENPGIIESIPKTYADDLEMNVDVLGYPICSKEISGVENLYLYDKLSFKLPVAYYGCEKSHCKGVEVIIIEQKANPIINGFKIVVEGVIGDNEHPFIAETTIEDLTVSFSTLGMNLLDFYAKLCVPKGIIGIDVVEEFDFDKFDVACITPISKTKMTSTGKVYFDANVLICYSVKKALSSIIRESLAVPFEACEKIMPKNFYPCENSCK